jgi:hypothetical protein
LHIPELGQEARDRIAQPDQPFLDEHHHGDAGHRLGHRGDAEEGVLRHRLLRFEVHQAMRLEVDDPSAPGDERHGAGDLAGVDVALDRIVDPRQPLRRHARLFELLGLTGRRAVGGERRHGKQTGRQDTCSDYASHGAEPPPAC